MKKIRVGIADDHAVVRAGLRAVLGEIAGLDCAGEASDGWEALDLVKAVPLDVLVLDLAMPRCSGLDILKRIVDWAPQLGVLVYTGCDEQTFRMRSIRLGAGAFVSKDAPVERLLEVVRGLGEGHRFRVEIDELPPEQPPRSHDQLSARELQVLLKLAHGASLGDAGKALSLSTKSITTYRTQLLRKLNLSTASDLTHYALTNQLIAF